jgi:hypothetical protein
MAQRKKAAQPRYTQIAIYAPPPLYNLVVREAERRRRRLGPTCMEILWEYFEKSFQKGVDNVRIGASQAQ